MNGLRSIASLACLSLAVAIIGCSHAVPPPPPSQAPAVARAATSPATTARLPIPLPGRGTIQILGRSIPPTFQVEVARTEPERTQGLMYRPALGEGKGMVFFMPRDNDWSFYMRNTRLPLDIIFIDSSWRVVGVVANAAPLTLTLRNVRALSRYVLELDAHQAAHHGIRLGTQLRFVASVP